MTEQEEEFNPEDMVDIQPPKSKEEIKEEQRQEKEQQRQFQKIQKHQQKQILSSEQLKLIDKITGYFESDYFKEYLLKRGYTRSMQDLKQMDLNELEEYLQIVKKVVRNKNTGSFYLESYRATTHTLEKLTMHPKIKEKFNLEGFSDITSKNEHILSIIEEIRLEKGDISNVPPEYRLLFTTLQIAVAVNDKNKQIESIQNPHAKNIAKMSSNFVMSLPQSNVVPSSSTQAVIEPLEKKV